MGQTTLNIHPSAGSGGPTPPPHKDLYAKREQIYPKLAHGKFRLVKWVVMAVTLGVYYLLPWIRWDRGEGIPNQAVLADFESEKFYFFFIEIWPQDIHFLAGLLILAALALFLVTSLLGRVWCGYTCPQTVWTDLYIWVERAFEGDRHPGMIGARAGCGDGQLVSPRRPIPNRHPPVIHIVVDPDHNPIRVRVRCDRRPPVSRHQAAERSRRRAARFPGSCWCGHRAGPSNRD